jgi:vesicular inhibitory amino acid transporter
MQTIKMYSPDLLRQCAIDSESGIAHIEEYQQATARHGSGSSFLAYFNVVCVIAGTGTLGLPAALKLGGWIGLLILFLSWTMSIVSARLQQ